MLDVELLGLCGRHCLNTLGAVTILPYVTLFYL